ncbi:MAG: PAS domain-containing sensor histidine kinase [Ignavibacteria bacterium]|nr:PAS domain-containing sensor histidine kinase [Ignavibacteria bacterium]
MHKSEWFRFIHNLLSQDFLIKNYPFFCERISELKEEEKEPFRAFQEFPLPLFIFDTNGDIELSNTEFLILSQKIDFGHFELVKIQHLGFKFDDIKSDLETAEFCYSLKQIYLSELGSGLEIHFLFYKIGKAINKFLGVILFETSEIEKIKQLVKTFSDLEIVFNNIPYFVYCLDTSFRVIRANQFLYSQFSLSKEKVEGKLVESVFPSKIAENCRSKGYDVAKTLRPLNSLEEKIRLDTEKEFHLVVERVPLFYREEFSGILVVGYNITEKKRNEIELRKWKQRFDLVTTATLQAVFERDWKTGQVIWTENVEELFGYSPDELTSREKWLEKISPFDKEKYVEIFQKHCDSCAPYSFVYRVKDAKGLERYVRETGFFLTEEGEISSVVGIISDVTKEKSLEQKVYDIDAFLNVLLDNLPIPVFFENIEGEFLRCNKYFNTQILEIEKRAVVYKKITEYPEIFSEEYLKKHFEKNRAILNSEKVDCYDERVYLLDGTYRDFLIFKAGYRDFDGNLVGILNFFIDVTERKEIEERLRNLNLELERKVDERTKDLQFALEEYKFEVEEHRRVQEILEQANYELKILNDTLAEESRKLIVLNEKLQRSEAELREANSAKDKFFTILAHDLKNPLQSILTDSEILERFFDTFSTEKIREYVSHIYKTSNLLKNLLENLLTWAKTQTGRVSFRPEWVNINLLIVDVIRFIEPAAKSKSIEIIYDNNVDFMVFLDRNLISTVIRNLLSNAIKYSYRGGKIIVKVEHFYEANMPALKVSIIDYGVGIEKETQGKLFKIEHNIATVGTEKEYGTGLGLILCYELIRLHNGRIWVESEPGKGSTFSFTVPINFD